MKLRLIRRFSALLLSCLTLWFVSCAVDSGSLSALLARTGLPKKMVQWELADLKRETGVPLAVALALRQSPQLSAAVAEAQEDAKEAPPTEEDAAVPPEEATPETEMADLPVYTPEELAFHDNGVPAETVHPTTGKGYTVIGDVFIKNTSVRTLDPAALSDGTFAAALSGQAPQVLIIHTHGSEAYTMPEGESYPSSGSFRTGDARYSVIRVGDEIAATLSSYGISVLHDRELYDSPAYNGSYGRSMAAIRAYQEKYPSLSFILDIHRDAIEDSDGHQYKVICQEDPHAAQVSLVMGSDYDHWQDNLKLAVSVQQTICAKTPTLMRPITLRNSGYNQEASTGSMLVEVGAAGNSLDEAIYAGRLFAQGFAETITQQSGT